MVESAVNVTTPELIDQVPSPVTTKLPLVMQVLGVAGSTMQLVAKFAEPVVASGVAPESMSVKVVVLDGKSVLVCGAATGAAGAATTGVIVAMTFWPTTSATAYLIAGAVPEKVITGVNVTVLPFSVYVPTGLFKLS
jgi:nucleotide-binding universal stress UspA family protein